MSNPLFEEHEATIKRLGVTQDAIGGQVQTYTTANRGSLKIKWKCRASRMSQKDKIDHGVRADRIGWKFLGETDPSITVEDQLTFTYVTSTKTVKITSDSVPIHPDGRIWRCYGEEDKTES